MQGYTSLTKFLFDFVECFRPKFESLDEFRAFRKIIKKLKKSSSTSSFTTTENKNISQKPITNQTNVNQFFEYLAGYSKSALSNFKASNPIQQLDYLSLEEHHLFQIILETANSKAVHTDLSGRRIIFNFLKLIPEERIDVFKHILENRVMQYADQFGVSSRTIYRELSRYAEVEERLSINAG
ncbi:hypothetical protein W03_18030 [Nitrosomonas sp. PY1]|uniref:helix-turn-helix domain-containing protein n=1 Tax=Nitrosomonas sp. PY1 TaxID=1803906 RepID=UPI001FC8A70B|nr:helix-turn-helix domain-containing protein [Nitrosomonas sp. PY1]GKS69799.1 hypothetical protein W03_18030 [Nitrosomonas sp. PY1]